MNDRCKLAAVASSLGCQYRVTVLLSGHSTALVLDQAFRGDQSTRYCSCRYCVFPTVVSLYIVCFRFCRSASHHLDKFALLLRVDGAPAQLSEIENLQKSK